MAGTSPQQPTAGDGATTRQPLVWLTAAAMFSLAFLVVNGLLNSEGPAPREPERRAAASAPDKPPDQHPGLEGNTVPRPQLSPDALFVRGSPAVVQVVSQDRQNRTISSGSGFLVSTKGLIATNHHVIEKAHKAHVILADKRKMSVEGVAALDEEADLALIKVAGQISAQPLELTGNDLPPVGTKVYAIGNPLEFANTLSDGLVSGHRDGEALAGLRRITVIQTTAPISSGSSGGPLLGADGRVVGVTTFGYKSGQNLNFAVPAFHVARLLRGCEGQWQLTRLPLVRQSADGWSPHDVENAAHFVRALRASNAAWALSRKTGRGGQPWLMADDDVREFARLIGEANREARLVRNDVLKRMHVLLPDAFDDFITATYYIGPTFMARRPDQRVKVTWERWARWWQANGPDVHVPKSAATAYLTRVPRPEGRNSCFPS